MNKLTKVGAAALFTLFLAACDKAADKPAEAAKPAATTEVAKPATTTEATKPAETAAPTATESTATSTVTSNQQGVEDYKKLVVWNQEAEPKLAALQTQLVEKLGSKDPKQIEEAQQLFTEKFNEVLSSLEALEIKDEAVNNFKQKTKDIFLLSKEIMADSVKAITTPTPELKQGLMEKTQKITEAGAELQKLQAELQQKFAQ